MQPVDPRPVQQGLSLSYAYGALAAVAVVSALTQRLARAFDFPETLRPVLAGSTAIAMLGMCIVGCVWVARAWQGVRAPTDMSANEAAMRLVIPLYGLYWMFAVHARLCAKLDARLAASGPSRAPRGLATLAAIATLVWWSAAKASPDVTVVSLSIAGAAWYAYMKGVDRLRAGLR